MKWNSTSGKDQRQGRRKLLRKTSVPSRGAIRTQVISNFSRENSALITFLLIFFWSLRFSINLLKCPNIIWPLELQLDWRRDYRIDCHTARKPEWISLAHAQWVIRKTFRKHFFFFFKFTTLYYALSMWGLDFRWVSYTDSFWFLFCHIATLISYWWHKVMNH